MKVELDGIEIHHSTLSNNIYAGTVNKEQTEFTAKTIVTKQAILAVISLLLNSEDEMLIVSSEKINIKLKATITEVIK